MGGLCEVIFVAHEGKVALGGCVVKAAEHSYRVTRSKVAEEGCLMPSLGFEEHPCLEALSVELAGAVSVGWVW